MLYDQYFIDDLSSRADLVRIVEAYVPLKKKGANWMACCPFHSEKTPSFSVNPSKGFFKCFGCGKGGNAYTFLMEIEGLSFPEAIKRVADISGVPLPQPITNTEFGQNEKRREEKKQLEAQILELNGKAIDFWESELAKKNTKAKAARAYLEKRGISEEILKKFRIGYAPDSWDALLSYLRGEGSDDEIIEKSGLVSVGEESEKVFDRFRDRIIFPVFDVNGNAIAFGARALSDAQPKYLNSPETPVYVKGRHLYGLSHSKDSIRQRKFVILVEGYLDYLALYQFGITNAAASLGTAFTHEQARLLGRFTKKIVVNYDGDKAGIKAANRAIEQLLPNNFDIKVLVLPGGQDPDDFVRGNGAAAYNESRSRAVPFLNFVLDSAIADKNLASAGQKAEAIEEVLPVLASIRNPIQKRETFDQAMTFFRVEDSSLKRELWHSVRSGARIDSESARPEVRRAARLKITVAEQQLLELLIYDRELRAQVLPILEETDYASLATSAIFSSLYELDGRSAEITLEAMLGLCGSDEAAADFIPLLMMAEPKRALGESIDEVFHQAENCILTLRSMAISHRIFEISQELIAAEQSGDAARVNYLAAEQIDLARMKRELLNKIAQI